MLSYIKKVPGKGLIYKKNGHGNIEAYSAMQEIKEIGSLLQDIVPMLGETWLHNAVKSKMLSLGPMLNLSIDLCLRLLVR